MKIITKIISFLLLVGSLAQAGIQDGKEIPDTITLHNSSHIPIEFNDICIQPGKDGTIPNDHSGSLVIKHGSSTYNISCPSYESGKQILEILTYAHLDFRTIYFIAHALKKDYRGLDQISINNDSLYRLAIVYSFNKVRSHPKIVDPNEETSKVVSSNDPKDTIGYVYLTDTDKKISMLKFKRRIYTPDRRHTCDWRSETLSANTIAWFGKGFQVTVADTQA